MESKHIFEFGPFRLDAGRRMLSRDGDVLPLTSKVFETLLALVQNHQRVLLKDELMKMLWPDSFVEEANLAQNVSALRKIFGESPGENRYIATIPGKGYRFVGDVRRVPIPDDDIVVERHSHSKVVVRKEEETELPDEIGQAASTALLPAASPQNIRWNWPVTLAVTCCAIAVLALGAYFIWNTRRSPESASGPPLRSIAVLPFRPLTGTDAGEHLGMGVTDAVITKLSNVRQLVVRPTSSVLRYADGSADAAKAGRELAVESLLDGKVQKSGDRIRVTVQLVRVQDGRPLWAETFDEKLTDVFAVEDSISEKVAQTLATKFGNQEKKQIARHYTENIEAYRDYVQGRYYEFRFTRDGLNQAIREFDRAIQLDPSYALAYAGLADAYTTASDWVLSPREALPKAEAAARKALVFDDQLADAHAALAHALLHEWRLPAAGKEFERALSLTPNDTSFYFTYSEYLSALGQEDAAVAELRKALVLDPLSPEINTFIAWPLYLKRDYDGALASSNKAIRLYPEFWEPHAVAGIAYLMKGQPKNAIAELEKARSLNPDFTGNIAALAAAHASSGNRGEAEKLLAELKNKQSQQYVSPVDIASAYESLGQNDEAFAWLQKAYNDQSEMLIFLKFDPEFDRLRGDPRFHDLVRKVELSR